MLRYRRYRAFVVFAVLTVLVLWQFAGSETWTSSSLGSSLSGAGSSSSSSHGSVPAADDIPDALAPPKSNNYGSPIATEDKDEVPDVEVPQAEKPEDQQEPPALPQPSKPVQGKPPPAFEDEDSFYLDGDTPTSPHEPQVVVPHEGGEGRKEIEDEEKAIHWHKLEEHFPVTSTIQLPAGSPKPVPKIQATFPKESSAEVKERKAQLMAIKEAMTFSWNGYRKYAWMKDELSPVSNGSRNPFAGWGATLVDALDTLYIMGMEDEFEEAVAAVAEIDFTTTFRKDIPLFETVIRYLGGLIAAYDISGLKHRILLDKAVELAEVLMGAFDTPNRMPMTFYYWMPTYASQPHRAGTRVVLAEIGSLSVEFTRLAQLTKEPKYYDAIARITNAFMEWQDTLLPGMWPVHVDASGCKRPEQPELGEPAKSAHPPLKAEEKLIAESHVNKNNPERFGGKNPVPDDDHDDISDDLVKRQLDDPLSLSKAAIDEAEDEVRTEKASSSVEKDATFTTKTKPTATLADCAPQGLAPASIHGSQQFTLGGMSDSMYEYFPKEYLLLGGLAPEYQELYEKSADAVKSDLLYRPMLPDGSPDMLFSGTLSVTPPDKKSRKAVKRLKHEGTHLTCFAGGMFAYGAKIFKRTEDVKIGAELTEGCVWAYNVTATGIMPESFLLTPCDDLTGCEWNQTRWHEELDPNADSRQETYQRQLKHYSSQVAIARAKATATSTALPEFGIATAAADAEAIPTNAIPNAGPVNRWDRRQLGGVENDVNKPTRTTYSDAHEPAADVLKDDAEDMNDPAISHIWKPQKPLTHEAYVDRRIKEERLPTGFTRVESRHYILRPEAIESVWYMYRITGDRYWREAGWNMFTAIQTYCRAEFGYSAIDDITKSAPTLKDEMESFWLAETLKYFWLLFADEDVVSLDEWVLNTEAHPFRRPDAGPWPPKA
ncbi:Glycoside hydrolase family 47 [Lasiodiplodia theobromae]|uniref:Class i alpha-mannosidase 1a n=1 Tax=Lasiodiplodia theobromae TaxID=45133 RepID=UPI0015C3B0F9|nr:Class i alpha-mannosidase 1a [Lasiodiplodia theobromae]KAF4539486.1 Class i alpha-mannosidase 1a [Lasiodiplodia theobromae]KAF9639300.1 Glycoside hydrolase family 47 [Lasiodiplodia theobromae]